MEAMPLCEALAYLKSLLQRRPDAFQAWIAAWAPEPLRREFPGRGCRLGHTSHGSSRRSPSPAQIIEEGEGGLFDEGEFGGVWCRSSPLPWALPISCQCIADKLPITSDFERVWTGSPPPARSLGRPHSVRSSSCGGGEGTGRGSNPAGRGRSALLRRRNRSAQSRPHTPRRLWRSWRWVSHIHRWWPFWARARRL